MKGYKDSIGGEGEVGQTEPITIDIDIRYVPSLSRCSTGPADK